MDKKFLDLITKRRGIHLFKIRGAKTEVFYCLRFCIFEANTLFCVQRLVSGQILLSYLSSVGNH